MKKILKEDRASGLRLLTELIRDPAGQPVQIYFVWQMHPSGSGNYLEFYGGPDHAQAEREFGFALTKLRGQ